MATILFDLDGTLIDTASLVLPAFRETLRQFPEAPRWSDEELKATFGMPDGVIWQRLLPTATPELRAEAYRLSEALIREAMFRHDVLLPDALTVLKELRARGHTLTIASNCGQEYLDAVLDSQGLRPLFDAPLCLGGIGGTRKADILARHFERFPRAEAVMVGDRRSDIEAARAHGIPCIGCALGFGSSDELADADVVIHRLDELLALFPAGSTPLLPR